VLPLASANTVTVGLYADSLGQPGTLLEAWTVAVPNTCQTSSSLLCDPPPLTTLTSILNPLLTVGARYWFGMG
jgi:hypothetical protein